MSPAGTSASSGSHRPGLVETVRRANQPGPPEDSVAFRLATLLAVLSGIVACAHVGELSATAALAACIAVTVGMAFSYVSRRRSHGVVKIALAVAVLGIFAAFVTHVFGAARSGELSSIEVPLAGLFTWVQVVHAFDVPARRDLLFSLAAGAALITVGAAQAISAGFVVFVAIWMVATVVALGCSWRSMSGGRGGLSYSGLVGASLLAVAVALVVETVLPAPKASQAITLPSSIISYLSLPNPGGLSEGGAHPTEPAKAGSPGGATRIGGFVGFAGPLDTALRSSLGTSIVMRVRAGRPGYFLGETFNHWDGQSWTERPGTCRPWSLHTGSPFALSNAPASGPENIQTFYVAEPLPNLLFSTSVPELVYFPDHSLYLGCDGSIRSGIAMTPGTVYTVVASDSEVAPSRLLSDRAPISATPAAVRSSFLQLPHPYPRVRALAESIVRKARATGSIAARIGALEAWMSRHTEYSTDIPPLRPGEDAVDSFLFGSRIGYCEQISTALTVMLRSLGIAAREAIGYVPGSYDPLTDLYEIRADDAHAWVQAYIPGFGWQSFDPTAKVPLAPADPGAVLLSDVGHSLGGLPWVPIGICAAVAGSAFLAERRRRILRARPPTWEGRATERLERLGASCGVLRQPSETLAEYGRRFAGVAALGAGASATVPATIALVVSAVNAAAYGPPPTRAPGRDGMRAPGADAMAGAGAAEPAQGQHAVSVALDELARALVRTRMHRSRLKRAREPKPPRSEPPGRRAGAAS